MLRSVARDVKPIVVQCKVDLDRRTFLCRPAVHCRYCDRREEAPYLFRFPQKPARLPMSKTENFLMAFCFSASVIVAIRAGDSAPKSMARRFSILICSFLAKRQEPGRQGLKTVDGAVVLKIPERMDFLFTVRRASDLPAGHGITQKAGTDFRPEIKGESPVDDIREAVQHVVDCGDGG